MCVCVFQAQLCRHLVLTEPTRILELERGERPLEGLYKKNLKKSLIVPRRLTHTLKKKKKMAARSDSALQELEKRFGILKPKLQVICSTNGVSECRAQSGWQPPLTCQSVLSVKSPKRKAFSSSWQKLEADTFP